METIYMKASNIRTGTAMKTARPAPLALAAAITPPMGCTP
jgi:hypothetical protein